jgi:hypothetical protein
VLAGHLGDGRDETMPVVGRPKSQDLDLTARRGRRLVSP